MKYDVIVSLTTWKGRINDPHLPKVIFRLLQQETQFIYKVVLVLSREEFGATYKVPEQIDLLTEDPRFEILWTDKNTKALKKLNPTMAKYPDTPIITTDDDILLKKHAVDMMIQAHLMFPNAILGTVCGAFYPPVCRVANLRLFPPHSLADIPDIYFSTYFHNLHDDEWNGIRAMVKGTQHLKVADDLIDDLSYYGIESSFRQEYNKFRFKPAYAKFKKEHPKFNLE